MQSLLPRIPNFAFCPSLITSCKVNVVQWLVSMPAVQLVFSSLLTIYFGLASRDGTFGNTFYVLFQKV